MRPDIKEFLKYAVGLVLAVGLLYWIFRDIDPREVGEALAKASIGGLILSGLLQIGHNVFRVWRWGVLLRPVPGRPTQSSMWVSVILGYTVSWVLPGRLGELVRPALLSGRDGIPLVPCIGTVVVDRLFDMISIVTVFSVGLLVSPLPEGLAFSEQLRAFAFALLPAALTALFVLAALARWREPLHRRFADRPGLVARVARTALDLVRGGEALRRPGSLVLLVLSSLAAWTTIVTGLWVGLNASGAPIPFFGALVLLPAIALGGATPTPGGTGGFHAAVTYGLTELFLMDKAAAVSTAVLLHLTSIVPPIAAGLGIVAIGSVRWSDLRRIIRQARNAGGMQAEEGSAS